QADVDPGCHDGLLKGVDQRGLKIVRKDREERLVRAEPVGAEYLGRVGRHLVDWDRTCLEDALLLEFREALGHVPAPAHGTEPTDLVEERLARQWLPDHV